MPDGDDHFGSSLVLDSKKMMTSRAKEYLTDTQESTTMIQQETRHERVDGTHNVPFSLLILHPPKQPTNGINDCMAPGTSRNQAYYYSKF